jgi:hypothetical protein
MKIAVDIYAASVDVAHSATIIPGYPPVANTGLVSNHLVVTRWSAMIAVGASFLFVGTGTCVATISGGTMIVVVTGAPRCPAVS